MQARIQPVRAVRACVTTTASVARPARAAIARCAASSTDTRNAVMADRMMLGASGVEVSSVGVGAWSWGDRTYWGTTPEQDNFEAFKAMLEAGLSFVDTAEVYGFGKSEQLIGEFSGRYGVAPVVATKFAPLMWRFSADSVVAACEGSLTRLNQKAVALYMIHWPGFLLQGFSNDAFVDGLARCAGRGLASAVGVSNFNEERLRGAQALLQARGLTVASNQIQYSLLYREPERNGLLSACRELGVTPLAYSPMAQGLLTGRYTVGGETPSGPRSGIFNEARLREVEPLIGLMRDVGAGRGGKTPAQVAINWCLCKGTLPLPGAKNAKQMQEIAGAAGWRLSEDEVKALDDASFALTQAFGAPFENW